MKFKWYWVIIPPCITFGPLFMADIGSNRLTTIMASLMGALMVSFGLGCMFSMIFEQRKVIEQLTQRLNRDLATNAMHDE
jgi:hypothetical protein